MERRVRGGEKEVKRRSGEERKGKRREKEGKRRGRKGEEKGRRRLKSYGDFAVWAWVDIAYWWSCIGKGLCAPRSLRSRLVCLYLSIKQKVFLLLQYACFGDFIKQW